MAVGLFATSWGLLHVGFLAEGQIVDTPAYERYGDRFLAGELPYRDFSLEYPPGALPAFIAPSLASKQDYRTIFEALMLTCGLALVALVAFTLGAVRAPPARIFAAVALSGIAPLALGSVILTRYDPWPVKAGSSDGRCAGALCHRTGAVWFRIARGRGCGQALPAHDPSTRHRVCRPTAR